MLKEEENKIIDESRQGEALVLPEIPGNGKKLYIESYGCAMNFADTEIIASIMKDQGFMTTPNAESADLIFLFMCVRDCKGIVKP